MLACPKPLSYRSPALLRSCGLCACSLAPLNVGGAAGSLPGVRLAAWLNDGQSVVGVFKLLHLSDDGYLALTSRKLEVLEDYIALFNREKSAEKTLLATLTAGFSGERRLAELLAVAKANGFTKLKAEEFESALFNKWLGLGQKPETILKNLKLDNNVKGALSDLNLQTLANYISVFNKKYPVNEASLLGTFTAHYGEDIVAKGLVSAKKGVAASGKSVDDVDALLKIKQDGLAAFVSRKLDTLDEYIKLFNSKKSAHESLIGVLATAFGGKDQLAATLAAAKRK
ncbi:hypothetical protein PHYSODRAFT_250282 [Phytophthora sojae]|uniref:RxLR effector protein n=1 Tax=Phytophthora sojae (strain P6497) TaxID=1094619 RepID=G4ZMF0_PHYSP|nr:hypothetical protein PHYSODRAFT_250282 [Phytophthora sojae]EGZ15003.1 hypothetical protein PHYSODRAFT_250282 [Phytophthora sojae]|eukprot:XP_009528752.1 hypothetical protein PHYSODRAFT_250282 [Phytophthora sojae]